MSRFPASIDTVETLEELLSRPTPALVAMMSRLKGDILFLGAGGKMGPTMARMVVDMNEIGCRQPRHRTPGNNPEGLRLYD